MEPNPSSRTFIADLQVRHRRAVPALRAPATHVSIRVATRPDWRGTPVR